jgi:hypothetical protein
MQKPEGYQHIKVKLNRAKRYLEQSQVLGEKLDLSEKFESDIVEIQSLLDKVLSLVHEKSVPIMITRAVENYGKKENDV